MIEVWDTGTLDSDLQALLDDQRQLILAYHRRDAEIFLSHDLATGLDRPSLRPSNEHARPFIRFEEGLIPHLEARTIRGFHYTRLADHEVDSIRRNGIDPSTFESLKGRLEGARAQGLLSEEDCELILAQSPFRDETGRRSDMFWMTSAPYPPEYPGVQPLMQHWGGEVAFAWLEDGALLDRLARIGSARILEVAVPLSSSPQVFSAVQAVVAAYARANGAPAESKLFDLYVEEPLPAEAIIAVHTVGDESCAALSR